MRIGRACLFRFRWLPGWVFSRFLRVWRLRFCVFAFMFIYFGCSLMLMFMYLVVLPSNTNPKPKPTQREPELTQPLRSKVQGVNMPLSPPTFEAICEIGIFTAASLHIERLHIAAPACLLYTQHQLASVHVHSAPHAARAACTCTYKAPFIKPPFTVATSIVRLLCTF